jgi:hypothetical protein
MSPLSLPEDSTRLRARLRQMSVLELYARGREALRQCRPEIERSEPFSYCETLVAEIRDELERRFPRRSKRLTGAFGA